MNTRIKDIINAAIILFLRQGYAKTQISHIAKAAGVSVGTIYLCFTGKKEILHLILKHTLDSTFLENELEKPITDALFVNLEDEIAAAFERSTATFSKHLENHAADYCFESLISDAFDLLARYAVGCLFIEKNQFEFQSLACHYRSYRKQFFDTMTQYIQLFVDNGTVRKLDHLELSTTLIIEILSWWAMDMRYIAFESHTISLDLAKQVCLDNILTAYQQ